MSMDANHGREVVDDYTNCHTWLIGVIQPKNSELVCPKLLLDIKANIVALPHKDYLEDYEIMFEDENYCVNCYEDHLELDLPIMDMGNATSSWAAIFDKLSSFDVPPQAHQSIADSILGDTFAIARDPRHIVGGHKVLHMEAMIHVFVVDSIVD